MPVLLVSRDGAVVHVTLNRPEVRNAFDERLVAALSDWAEAATADAGIRAAVLGGAGATFCAGADLAWMSRAITYSREDNFRDAAAMARMFERLDTLPFPVIGRVQGAALGGGTGLAAICDVVIAAEDATFGFTEVKLGILPATIAPYVIRKIGVSAARALFLTGRRFPAARAQALGLVHGVVPAAELDAAVAGHVREVLSAGPAAVAAAKALIPQVAYHPPADTASLTAETIARQRTSAEGQEGMRAFLEKRKPAWVREDR